MPTSPAVQVNPVSFQAFYAAIESEDLRVLARHWEAVRGRRRMPAWRNIDPVEIGRSLRYIWSWKYDRTSDAFIGRLAGEEIDRAFGKSLRGMRMEDFYTPEIYHLAFPRHRRVVNEPGFMRGKGMVFVRLGLSAIGERIVLPLSEDGEEADGIIGGTYYRPVPEPLAGRGPGQDLGPEQAAFFPLDYPA